MSAEVRRRPVTSVPSFSFYVTPSNTTRIETAAEFGDALTVAGPKGPDAIRRLRQRGFNRAVLFDGMGYAGKDLLPEAWAVEQRSAGADRVLLPGVFLAWDKSDVAALELLAIEQNRIAIDLDATLVLAIDARWIAKRAGDLVSVLREVNRPVALVLADRGDPLSHRGAVDGLRMLLAHIPELSLLRTDHGGVGALAFGAEHVSIGLTTTTRHFAASGMSPRRIVDNTARLFVQSILDWYRAAEVAGWEAAGKDFLCHLSCCNGGHLARYLDPDLDATFHNMNALADFSDYILNADPIDRPSEYLRVCRSAVGKYGLAGFNGPEDSKAQLNAWAFS